MPFFNCIHRGNSRERPKSSKSPMMNNVSCWSLPVRIRESKMHILLEMLRKVNPSHKGLELEGLIWESLAQTWVNFAASVYSIQAVICLPLWRSIPIDSASTEAKDMTVWTSTPMWFDSHWYQQVKDRNLYRIQQSTAKNLEGFRLVQEGPSFPHEKVQRHCCSVRQCSQ